ncbi:MAG TPA: M15 family metallopeptidase [Candidatus Kapabacteria bacterium]|nr:M15 family metallopeptidase [Candidatus Kapabacteria bacterium]
MRNFTYFILGLCLLSCRPEQAPSQQTTTQAPNPELTSPDRAAPIEAASAPAVSKTEKAVVLPPSIVSISGMEGVRLDLRYRTANNFIGEDLYGDYAGHYLHRDAAEKLGKAAMLLAQEKPGWKLRVLDALRPREIQRRLFARVKGTSQVKYVADPHEGSGHNYGMSVDVTLEDERGHEVDMGTPFDDFTPLAQPRNEAFYLRNGKLTKEQHQNRLLLRRIMKQAGFGSLLQEWWHFNARGIKTIKSRYTVIDQPF